jgi:glycosyltransferase involved in cell wall biosynthesis
VAALASHNWIASLPHDAVLDQMRQHDVLVLPSLFEGYALVINESLAQGLPVIATVNSGATESVRDGVEGFIVPIRDSHVIAERLDQLAANPELLTRMRSACLHRAEELTWDNYETRIRGIVAHSLSDTSHVL